MRKMRIEMESEVSRTRLLGRYEEYEERNRKRGFLGEYEG